MSSNSGAGKGVSAVTKHTATPLSLQISTLYHVFKAIANKKNSEALFVFRPKPGRSPINRTQGTAKLLSPKISNDTSRAVKVF